jgi:hypothetical protein
MKRLAATITVAAAVLLSACQTGTAPLDNPTGSKASLAATPSEKKASARSFIAQTKVGATSSGNDYVRSKFGPSWPSINGCDMRNGTLTRDLTDVTYNDSKKCIVNTGVLNDPYSGEKINFQRGASTSSKVQIDHVIPLSYAWKMGARGWTDTQRRNFANDPLNLMAVKGSVNGSKSDSGPAEWMPPKPSIHCSYSVRFAQVAQKYNLPIQTVDRAKMDASCR